MASPALSCHSTDFFSAADFNSIQVSFELDFWHSMPTDFGGVLH
jgi:hypothetical protein